MKYQVFDIENIFTNVSDRFITISYEPENANTFKAEKGNPNYDQFLIQAELTDAEVHELEPNVWYDFPE